jgi:hypothetical protein
MLLILDTWPILFYFYNRKPKHWKNSSSQNICVIRLIAWNYLLLDIWCWWHVDHINCLSPELFFKETTSVLVPIELERVTGIRQYWELTTATVTFQSIWFIHGTLNYKVSAITNFTMKFYHSDSDFLFFVQCMLLMYIILWL